MKSQSPHLVIVSCYQTDLPEVGNARNHYDLAEKLKLLSVPFTEVIGCYKGKIENSFMIPAVYERVARMIMNEYNQECYLEHHNDRSCELVYPNGARTKIGIMTEVPKEEAEKSIAWTLVPETGRYFIVK